MTLEEYYKKPHDYMYYRNIILNNSIHDCEIEEMVYSDNLSDLDVMALVILIRLMCKK